MTQLEGHGQQCSSAWDGYSRSDWTYEGINQKRTGSSENVTIAWVIQSSDLGDKSKDPSNLIKEQESHHQLAYSDYNAVTAIATYLLPHGT